MKINVYLEISEVYTCGEEIITQLKVKNKTFD